MLFENISFCIAVFEKKLHETSSFLAKLCCKIADTAVRDTWEMLTEH